LLPNDSNYAVVQTIILSNVFGHVTRRPSSRCCYDAFHDIRLVRMHLLVTSVSKFQRGYSSGVFESPNKTTPLFYACSRVLRYINTDRHLTYHTTTLVSLLVSKLYNTDTTDTSKYLDSFAPTEDHNSSHYELHPSK
jgi:hypothetical protein